MLTHAICSGWVKNKTTSTLAFDIAQFFLSLNHCLLTLSLKKVGFDPRVISFFADFLIQRKTKYRWNEFSSLLYEVNVRVGQGSALSPILSALYLSPLLYILEKHLNSLNVKIVNGGLDFLFSLYFTLFLLLLFIFLFLEQLGLGFISHTVTSVTNWWCSHKNWSRDLGKGSRRFWNKVTSYSMDNTCWPHVILMVV